MYPYLQFYSCIWMIWVVHGQLIVFLRRQFKKYSGTSVYVCFGTRPVWARQILLGIYDFFSVYDIIFLCEFLNNYLRRTIKLIINYIRSWFIINWLIIQVMISYNKIHITAKQEAISKFFFFGFSVLLAISQFTILLLNFPL